MKADRGQSYPSAADLDRAVELFAVRGWPVRVVASFLGYGSKVMDAALRRRMGPQYGATIAEHRLMFGASER